MSGNRSVPRRKPPAEIATALNRLPKGRPPAVEDWVALSTSRRESLDARIRRLTGLRDQFDGCIGCGCLSIAHCPLRNPEDALGAEGSGARLLDPD